MILSALGLANLAAVVVGLGVGYVVSVPERWVIGRLAGHPLAPLTVPGRLVVTELLITVVVTVVVALVLFRLGPRAGWWARLRHRIPWSLGRRLLAAALALRAVSLISGTSDINGLGRGALFLVVGVLLIVPDLLRLLLKVVRVHGAVGLTARRLMEAEPGRHAVAAMTVAACLALPLAWTSFVASDNRTTASQAFSEVSPHQIGIDAGGGPKKTIDQLRRIVGATPGLGAPIVLNWLSSDTVGVQFARNPGNAPFGLVVMDTPQELERVVGPLPADAIATLEAGGVADWSGASGPQRISVQRGDHPATLLPGALPTIDVHVTPAYQGQYGGAMLTATAEKLGLGDQITPAAYVWADISDDQSAQAVSRVVDAGYNDALVATYTPPLPTHPSLDWYLSGAGLSVVAFVILLVVLRGQALTLRSYASRFLALGLRQGWSARVLTAQSSLSLVVGLVSGLVAGILPIVIFASGIVTGLLVDVPLGYVLLMAGATVAAAAVAMLLAVVALRPAVHDDQF